MTQTRFFRRLLGALTIFTTACGAKVVVDEGIGGAGGFGQGGGGGSFSSTTSSSSSSTTSSSTGGLSPCDGTSSCEKCINCTLDLVCAEEWSKCKAVPTCLDLMYCLAACQNDEACIDSCVQKYPGGANQYNATAACVVCQACYSDCDGIAQGCTP